MPTSWLSRKTTFPTETKRTPTNLVAERAPLGALIYQVRLHHKPAVLRQRKKEVACVCASACAVRAQGIFLSVVSAFMRASSEALHAPLHIRVQQLLCSMLFLHSNSYVLSGLCE